MRERIEAEIAETQRPKVHFKMHLCHGGIKGNVLTAGSALGSWKCSAFGTHLKLSDSMLKFSSDFNSF